MVETERRRENEHDTLLAVMSEKLGNLEIQLAKMEGMLENKFVSKDEFTPVKNIVYGLVALILSAVFIALIALVVIKK